MDLYPFQENYSLIILEGLAITLLLYCLSFIYNKTTTTTTTTAPEASGAWPIIGHFNLFGASSNLPHLALASMADRYGPIFTVRLGIRRVLVVSSPEIAKEIFTTHDVIVSDRPKYLAAKILGHNYASLSFAPYGPYWSGMRKIISQELLSSSRLEKLKFVQVFELENSIKNMLELWREKRDADGKALVEMKTWFGELTMNTVLRMVAEKRYTAIEDDDDEEEMKRHRKVMREWFLYLGRFVVADTFPFLGWLDLGGHEKTMKRVATELDSMVGKWLDEHRRKRASDETSREKDFIDVMMSVVEDDPSTDYDADTIIKANCMTLIVSGTDTTAVTLTWALSLLLNNRYALRKAQEELEMHIGKDRQVNESDIKNLVYLQAVVKEALRLYPAAFLGGRRSCPAIGFGLQMTHMVLATLLHNFDMSTPDGAPVDMTTTAGMTNAKATPFDVVFSPRLLSTTNVICYVGALRRLFIVFGASCNTRSDGVLLNVVEGKVATNVRRREIHNMANVVATVSKQLENVSDALTSTKRHLSKRLETLDWKLDEQKEMSKLIADDVNDVKSNLNQIGYDIDMIHQMVAGLEVLKQDHSQLSLQAHQCADTVPDLNNMVSAVQALVAQCEDLKMKYNEEQAKRRKLHSQIEDAKGNIRVFCRCRLLSKTKASVGCSIVVDFEATGNGELGVLNGGSTKKTFNLIGFGWVQHMHICIRTNGHKKDIHHGGYRGKLMGELQDS
ncbi:hypothetical protein L6452_34007 [Arctium lappa]|uniref:Uncharacterized protein n=1 Tax=Arctium lappa TaxID=4217 RepID=A0ACB8YHP3_ARCLA|nr:hypothetical protein L6452_34007 [Arctium lappa]